MQYMFPALDFDWVKGGVVSISNKIMMYRYYDGQSNDARLNTIINRTSLENGANCLNYMEVCGLLHTPCQQHSEKDAHDIITGVRVRDVFTKKEYEVNATITVNAAGPFVDSVLKMYETARNPAKKIVHEDRIIPSKGVHLLLRGSYCPKNAGVVTMTSDKRVLFILPWQN